MDYKNTLNLPKTDFPMKGDLPKREPEFLARWQAMDIYKELRRISKGKPKYILHDGPPYANGNIHIGHALNKPLKDIIVKYKTMRGYDSAYIPGWDCHGLPVEHALFKELKINKYMISQVDFRKKAHDYAMKFVGTQREEFKRLGVFADWENPYLTLPPDYEEGIVGAFNELVKKGYIYRGLKPVNWCCRCETALAEAEVEYEDHTSPSVYVKFKIVDERFASIKDFNLVIWTTTPWTLLANVAVAVNPNFVYVHYATEKGSLIVAEKREQCLDAMGLQVRKKIGTFKGSDLEGLKYEHPFGIRTGKVVLADYVSGEDGTGLVHTAPGHGAEDYLTGLKYKLDIVMPVDPKGHFDATTGEFKGVSVYEANKPIIEKLQASGHLLLADKIRHSYPHCWRCKNPIIFRATNQWFMKIDHNGLRKELLRTIENNVEFIPQAGRERISSMIESRPDWCLSRQRYWGVPIPSLVCKKCNEEFLEPKVIEKWLSFIGKEGTDSWFIHDVKDFLPAGFKCSCGGDLFDKGMDILDVWFDSGASNQAVLKKREDVKEFPCSLYLEGSDQHRGWFQASLWVSMGVDGVSPFKSVLTHGFVVDGDGRKMSKSMGNVIAPAEILKNSGADILRLWAASSDYNEDIRISQQILQRLSEAYRKIRNTARFILSNLYDYDPSSDAVELNDFRLIDKWILSRLEKVKVSVTQAYDSFEFHKAFKGIYDFCNEDLSMYYMDMAKGRLYTARADSKARRASQTAMYRVVCDVVKLMAPILPFTSEDIWSFIPKAGAEKDAASVHMLQWPALEAVETRFSAKDAGDIAYMDSIMAVFVPAATKSLEEKRSAGIIGSSFDAKINLLTKDEKRYTSLESLKADLAEIFKVSEVTVRLSETLGSAPAVDANNPDVAIIVDKADGKKCERCWNYSSTVGTHSRHAQLCGKCVEAIQGGNKIEE